MANEVSRLLESMQTGEYIPDKTSVSDIQPKTGETRKKSFGPLLTEFITGSNDASGVETLGMEAAQAGYGESRYDKRFEFDPRADIEERRAFEQPGLWKVANGAIKGGIVAGTTAVETVAGVIDGLLEGGYELVREIAEDKNVDIGKVVGLGVNNFTARTMADIQRLSEEWFPNYRTQQERTEEYQRDWLKHIFTANFIGDSFLKNFGFTVGAIAGGSVWSKAISSALRASVAGNLMKGVTAAAEGNAEAKAALENTLKLIDGWSVQAVDDATLIKNIDRAAKALNQMREKQKLFGAVIGAFGEGTMEGVMARNEFIDNYYRKLNSDYDNSLSGLRSRLENELAGTDMTIQVPVLSPEGGITVATRLNAKGEERLKEEKKKIDDAYFNKRQEAENQGDRLAATTFAFNIPILTLSNTIQFGKLFSGGWKTARNTAKVAGGITRNAGKIVADYSVVGNRLAKTLGKSLKVGAAEATEEMLQGVVSSGATRVADTRMTSFNDDGYDRKAMKGLGAWFNSMLDGGADYLGDWKNWQEGFLGMITGLIGMPGRHWSGGIVEASREAKNEITASRESAEALNDRINSDRFRNAWEGYIRHMKYEDGMAEAVKNDDQYTWKTESDKQLISDVIMFADAGRLQDLKDIVDFYADMSDTDAENSEVIEIVSNADNANDAKNNPSEIIARVKEQAANVKEAIDMYNNMYNAMLAIAPVDASPEQIKELVATSMNIREFEKRFLSMFDEVIGSLDKYVIPLSKTDKNGEAIVTDADRLNRAKEVYTALAKVYTGTELPVETTLLDALDVVGTVNELKELVKKSGDKDLIKKLDDMEKVSEDRKAFLKKMMTLRDLDPVKYNEEKVTPEKVIEEQKKEKAVADTQDLNSLTDVKKAYFSKNAKDRSDYLSSLESVENDNPNVKAFLEIKRKHDGFLSYVANNPIMSSDITVTPPMIQSALNDIFRRAGSIEDLIKLPDSVFQPKSQFDLAYQSPFGPVSPTAYESVKKAVRDAMSAYTGIDEQTASRNTLSPTPVNVEQKNVDESKPEGRDASQPGSLEPAPMVNDNSHVGEKSGVKTEPPTDAVETPVAKTPDETGLMNDLSMSLDNDINDSVEEEKVEKEGERPKLAYYNGGMPEIDSANAREARYAIRYNNRERLKQVDLSDFPKLHPEYEQSWNALSDLHGFENTVSILDVGDKIEFVVDPSFPEYDGYQILMTVVKNNQRYVLNVLPRRTSLYSGLSELRSAIDAEYQEFHEKHPNDVFVFSKKATVWAKRAGLIDYDFSSPFDDGFVNEKDIKNIDGYSEDAPIVFIDRNGNAIVANGKDKSSVDKVSVLFNDASFNRGDVNGVDRRGNLYYLAKNPNGRFEYTPIRLWVEHFNIDTINSDKKTFSDIRDILGKIADIVKATNNINVAQQGSSMADEIAKLVKLLDINDIDFVLRDFGGETGVALAINRNVDGQREEGKMFRPDQINPDKLCKYIAGLNRSVQIKLDTDGNVENLDELINDGVITSNARMLRPKGVDFYTDIWNEDAEDFVPGNDVIRDYEKNLEIDESNMTKQANEPVSVDDDFQDIDEDDLNMEGVVTDGGKAVEREADSDFMRRVDDGKKSNDITAVKFADLPESTKTALINKGYSEEEYDSMPELAKDKVLKCL